MATADIVALSPTDLRTFQDKLGRVNHQPVSVHSFTNKRFTVNYRAPIDQIRKLLPPSIEPDEIRDTGLGRMGTGEFATVKEFSEEVKHDSTQIVQTFLRSTL